jgi:hypothetical protein
MIASVDGFDGVAERERDDRVAGGGVEEVVGHGAVVLLVGDEAGIGRNEGVDRGEAAIVRIGIEAAVDRKRGQPEDVGLLRRGAAGAALAACRAWSRRRLSSSWNAPTSDCRTAAA